MLSNESINQDFKVLKFDPCNQLKNYQSCLFIGNHNCGKSIIHKEFLFHQYKNHLLENKDVHVKTVSPTEDVNHFYEEEIKFIKNNDIQYDFNPHTFFTGHESNSIVILDDCMEDTEMYRHKNLRKYRISCRNKSKKNILNVLISYFIEMPKFFRNNAFNYIVIGPENSPKVKKSLYESFFGMIPTYQDFLSIFDFYTRYYGFIIIDVATNQLYWYRSDINENYLKSNVHVDVDIENKYTLTPPQQQQSKQLNKDENKINETIDYLIDIVEDAVKKHSPTVNQIFKEIDIEDFIKQENIDKFPTGKINNETEYAKNSVENVINSQKNSVENVINSQKNSVENVINSQKISSNDKNQDCEKNNLSDVIETVRLLCKGCLPTNVIENDHYTILIVAVPGIRKNEIEVYTTDGEKKFINIIITPQVETQTINNDQENNFNKASTKSIKEWNKLQNVGIRKYKISPLSDLLAIKTTLCDGVLTITIPKRTIVTTKLSIE